MSVDNSSKKHSKSQDCKYSNIVQHYWMANHLFEFFSAKVTQHWSSLDFDFWEALNTVRIILQKLMIFQVFNSFSLYCVPSTKEEVVPPSRQFYDHK